MENSMDYMIALPDDQYFAVPKSILEQYAVPEAEFNQQLKAKEDAGESIYDQDVEGQERKKETIRIRTVSLGVRG